MTNELLRLEEDMLYTEKGHFAAANELSRVHLALGVLATAAAAGSVATIVGDVSPVISGTLALLASLASAVLTFVKPEEKAAQHLMAARILGDIRVRSRQHREIDLHPDSGIAPEEWRAYPVDIRTAKAEADRSAPAVSDRRFAKAQKKIQSGDFAHDSVSSETVPPE